MFERYSCLRRASEVQQCVAARSWWLLLLPVQWYCRRSEKQPTGVGAVRGAGWLLNPSVVVVTTAAPASRGRLRPLLSCLGCLLAALLVVPPCRPPAPLAQQPPSTTTPPPPPPPADALGVRTAGGGRAENNGGRRAGPGGGGGGGGWLII